MGRSLRDIQVPEGLMFFMFFMRFMVIKIYAVSFSINLAVYLAGGAAFKIFDIFVAFVAALRDTSA